jgi:hypothetical protein
MGSAIVRPILRIIGATFGCDRGGKVHRDHDDHEQSA